MELEKNLKAEPEFINWLTAIVRERGSVSVRDAQNAGAAYVSERVISISQQTIRRYLDKLTSFEGRFMIDNTAGPEAVIVFRVKSVPVVDRQTEPGEMLAVDGRSNIN
jgi:hypothetical protein